MKLLTLRIPESLSARLDQLARAGRASRSDIVRRAIDRYLREGRSAAKGSVLALARDLAGAVRGPRDLSVGRRHLRGYGE